MGLLASVRVERGPANGAVFTGASSEASLADRLIEVLAEESTTVLLVQAEFRTLEAADGAAFAGALLGTEADVSSFLSLAAEEATAMIAACCGFRSVVVPPKVATGGAVGIEAVPVEVPAGWWLFALCAFHSARMKANAASGLASG